MFWCLSECGGFVSFFCFAIYFFFSSVFCLPISTSEIIKNHPSLNQPINQCSSINYGKENQKNELQNKYIKKANKR
jgi:hypothetical protein